MRIGTINKVILLTVLSIFIVAGELFAANPTEYITINQTYTRVANGTKGFYAFSTDPNYYEGMQPYFRVFIPPGTQSFLMEIFEGGNQMAVARFQALPAGAPQFPPSGYVPSNDFDLTQLAAADCWVMEATSGDLRIASESFSSPYLPVSRGGWLYVKVGGGSYSPVYYNSFIVQVDPTTYNNWWDNYGSNADHSINWENDIESTVIYSTNPTPTPTPSPTTTPSPTPSPNLPAQPVATPESGTLDILNPAISVTCARATQIYYTMTYSTDGSNPNNPSDPIPVFPQFNGQLLNGGTLNLPYKQGTSHTTIYKVKFQGANDIGAGPSTSVLTYVVDESLTQNNIQNGTDYSYLITNANNFLDPNKIFFITTDSSINESYSVLDLVTEYLKTLLPDISVTTKNFSSGIMMLVSAPSFNGMLFPQMIGSIIGTTDKDSLNINSSGDLEIVYKNIRIVLNMAGYDEDQLTSMIESDGLNIRYDEPGHVLDVSSNNNPDFKLILRYQFGAQQNGGTSNTSSGGITYNEAEGTFTIIYDDGTTQNLIPGILDASGLIAVLNDKGYTANIDSLSGSIKITKVDFAWQGAPQYYFYPGEQNNPTWFQFESNNSILTYHSADGYQIIDNNN